VYSGVVSGEQPAQIRRRPVEKNETKDYDDNASVFRSAVDERVWMCNIPDTDVATGLQASTSLRRMKAYVEEECGTGGWWVRVGDEWEYRWKNTAHIGSARVVGIPSMRAPEGA
jgi:hypothetical protein